MFENSTTSRRKSILFNDEYIIVDEKLTHIKKLFGITIYKKAFDGSNDLDDPKVRKAAGFRKD